MTLVLCAALADGRLPHASRSAGRCADARAHGAVLRLRPKGCTPDVSEQEWRDFVDREITPRFPNGLTLLDAHGQWRGEDGNVVREPSRVLISLHPPGEDAESKVEQIRRLYRERFAQEAVLRTDTMQRVSF
jgi:hypothetical protein